jgi:hypothetical protein
VEARQLAKKMGMLYFELSAKTGQNISVLINRIIIIAVNKAKLIDAV